LKKFSIPLVALNMPRLGLWLTVVANAIDQTTINDL